MDVQQGHAHRDHPHDGLPASAADLPTLLAALSEPGFVLQHEEHFDSLCVHCGPLDVTPHHWMTFSRRQRDGTRHIMYGSCTRCSSPYDYEPDDDTATPPADAPPSGGPFHPAGSDT